jgi:cardiolipin synthase
MKRRQTVVFAFLVLCLTFVAGQVRLVNSSTLPPRRAQEINQQCGYNCQMNIAPGSPTENDMIQVTVSGEWSNSCTPSYQSYQVVGNLIRVDAVVTGGPICLDVITPWYFSVDIGPLPGGFYRVDLYITDAPHQVPATLCATQSLVVLSSSTVLITAVYYDTYLTGDPDEAFRLMNVSASAIDLTDWTVTDGEGTVTLAGTLDAGEAIWIAREADDFASEFGFPPDYEYGADTDPTVPNLALTGNLTLANTGDQLVLKDDASALVDSVVYEGGSTTGTDWSGTGVEPYGQGYFDIEGQVLYRKLDQAAGLPIADTDTAADWAQCTDDDIDGKRVMYPGWDLERYFFPATFTETAVITYAVAPDNLYETVLAEIDEATESLYYEGYTFDNAHLADAIVARMTANPGMTVTVLLEGEPTEGIDDQEKWVCQQIENAGGQVYFMYNDDAAGVHDRYDMQRGKWMVIDEEVLLTGSENLDYSSMPADDKSDGTSGNRGVWLITDAPGAVTHALDVFRHDLDPAHHRDLFRWTAGDPAYGAPPAGFTPDYTSGGTAYAVQFPTPFVANGTFAFEMVQSPENSLRDVDSLLGMVARAGSGDTVLVEQLCEYPFWGPADSNPADDPNPRLEAYIAAARRGARVRLLLDSAYDDPGDARSNTATCAYVNGIATSESLDLSCLLGNPTGTGIHNKMVLVWDGGQGYVHTGSINGSENSSKNNRELAVQVRSAQAYNYLAGVFWHDWPDTEQQSVYLPVILRKHTGMDVGDLIRSFPAPTGTQPNGLAWDGSFLWMSSYMREGGIYKLDPLDGSVLSVCTPSVAQYDGYGGLTFDGTNLWQADSYGGEIYKLRTLDCSVISSIPSPDRYPSDLAWDGKHLWVCGYPSQRMYKLDSSDGSIVAEFDIPRGVGQAQTAGLAHDGAYLWLSGASEIFKIDPSNGQVVSSIPASVSRPDSLAWDGQYMWISSFDEAVIQLIYVR